MFGGVESAAGETRVAAEVVDGDAGDGDNCEEGNEFQGVGLRVHERL